MELWNFKVTPYAEDEKILLGNMIKPHSSLRKDGNYVAANTVDANTVTANTVAANTVAANTVGMTLSEH